MVWHVHVYSIAFTSNKWQWRIRNVIAKKDHISMRSNDFDTHTYTCGHSDWAKISTTADIFEDRFAISAQNSDWLEVRVNRKCCAYTDLPNYQALCVCVCANDAFILEPLTHNSVWMYACYTHTYILCIFYPIFEIFGKTAILTGIRGTVFIYFSACSSNEITWRHHPRILFP